MSHRLILDTDIGTDVDDLLTLAMVPGLPAVVLEAVTVVYGDTALRAKMAEVACRRMDLGASVHRGREGTMSGKPVMWAGHEGVGFPGLDEVGELPQDAVEVLVQRVASEPGGVDVVAIGPLTNIAAAIQHHPDFVAGIRHLTVMGGEFAHGWPEHNFTSDAAATDTVLRSGIPTTIMPLDQTLRVSFDRADLALVSRTHPLGDLLVDQAERFWIWLGSVMPSFPGNASAPHDLMALLALVEPHWFQIERVAVESIGVDGPDGRYRSVADERSPVSLVTDVDVTGVHDRLIEVLSGIARRDDVGPGGVAAGGGLT